MTPVPLPPLPYDQFFMFHWQIIMALRRKNRDISTSPSRQGRPGTTWTKYGQRMTRVPTTQATARCLTHSVKKHITTWTKLVCKTKNMYHWWVILAEEMNEESVKHRETNRETMSIMLNLNCCLEDFRLDCHQQVSTQKLPLQLGFPSSRLCRRINVSPSLENLIKKTCQGNGKKGNGSRTCVYNIRICNCKDVIIIWSTNL